MTVPRACCRHPRHMAVCALIDLLGRRCPVWLRWLHGTQQATDADRDDI